jgi:hypothetical protein
MVAVIVRWNMPQVCPKRESPYLTRAGRLRSRHGDGAVRVQGEHGRKFWTARNGRYAIRIDAKRRGVYPWLITLAGRSVRKGVAPTVPRLPPQ